MKKNQGTTTNTGKSKKKKISITKSVIASVLLTAAAAIVIFLLSQGSVTTTGQYPDNVSDEALTCTGENITYPHFAYDNAAKKTVEINALFAKGELKSIALTYSLYYNDASSITASEAHNHAAMNKSFAANGLGKADAYNAKYARMTDRMQLNLYATTSDFDGVAMKYFLLDNDALEPTTISDYQKAYEAKGLNCKTITN